ncbi:MAG: hypothetical protein WC264_00945 [Candidatus Paceibacterota bacterium]|jgi:hypothetical protein
MSYIRVNSWPETSFQYIYVNKTSSSEYAGDVLAGCFFGPRFSLEKIDNFNEDEKKKWPDAENIYQFYHGGYITFNLSEIIFLNGRQAYLYKQKSFGKNLDLGDEKNCWLTWDPYMKKIWIEEPREKERQRLEKKKLNTTSPG